MQQYRIGGGLPDVLSPSELYKAMLPAVGSKSQLPIYIGAHFTKAKVESFHGGHGALHANTGCSDDYGNYLMLLGTGLHNVNIRYRLQVQRMDLDGRAGIPYAHREAATHPNHPRLHWISKLGCKAGLKEDAHTNVYDIVEDTGEQFFMACLKQQQARNNQHASDELGFCTCRDCKRVLEQAQSTDLSMNRDNWGRASICARAMLQTRQRDADNDDKSAISINAQVIIESLYSLTPYNLDCNAGKKNQSIWLIIGCVSCDFVTLSEDSHHMCRCC
jgi:hypothetical protein